MSQGSGFSNLGFGLGLRPQYYDVILQTRPKVDWFEILTENFLMLGGRPRYYLEKIRSLYPIVMHGVSLSIGSTDPINKEYLVQVKRLRQTIEAKWISDHLCWTALGGVNSHDLLPLPYTEEALAHVVKRVLAVQDYLGERILLENVSSYMCYHASEMTEWEFLREVATQADCMILLDINNIFVSAFNHQFDPIEYIRSIPNNRVKQFHLAGHSRLDDVIVDTHDHAIDDKVWSLYRVAATLFPDVPTLIERDDKFPPFAELYAELDNARTIVLAEGAVDEAYQAATG